MTKKFVIRSINNSDQSLCVDIFKRNDNTFGFEEYRRDKETYEGWYKVNIYEHNIYLTEKEAFANACKYIHWLRENNKITDSQNNFKKINFKKKL